MKKTISLVLVCALLICSLLSLTSCGKMLMGKYRSETDLIVGKSSVTYEFGMFGEVTMTVNSLGKETVEEGKYEFNDEGDKITFTFENEDGTPNVTTYSFSSGTEDGKNFIKLTAEGLVKMETVFYQVD